MIDMNLGNSFIYVFKVHYVFPNLFVLSSIFCSDTPHRADGPPQGLVLRFDRVSTLGRTFRARLFFTLGRISELNLSQFYTRRPGLYRPKHARLKSYQKS